LLSLEVMGRSYANRVGRNQKPGLKCDLPPALPSGFDIKVIKLKSSRPLPLTIPAP
jgi:hypothetical protein